jgi:hypothetical protein
MLQEVQSRTLGRQKCPCPAGHLSDDQSRAAFVSIADVERGDGAGVQTGERLERDREAGDGQRRLRQEGAARAVARPHDGVRGGVSGSDVFVQRAPDQVAIEVRLRRCKRTEGHDTGSFLASGSPSSYELSNISASTVSGGA